MITAIDHFVITTGDIQKTSEFYKILGFRFEEKNGKYNLYSDNFKISLHGPNSTATPVATHVQKGSVDICFRTTKALKEIKEYLINHNINIEVDEVQREGFNGPMTSIYIKDPEGNLIEISKY